MPAPSDQGSSVTGRSSTDTQSTVVHESSVFGGGVQDSEQPYVETPRPWVVYTGQLTAHGYGTSIDAADGSSIAFVASANTRADAALIVRAVNAHDDLVAALRNVLAAWEHGSVREMQRAMSLVLVALAKASPATNASVQDAGAVTDGIKDAC